ncbi:MAG: molybdopterin-binding protein [Treponemataceae bacterium]|nr:MAG: molybdopterin-binding protein [Treponemataceae bacterium]
MKKIRVEDAVGRILCHDLTRIVKDEFKGVQFKKGRIVRAEDIPMLLSMGKEHLFVWEDQDGMIHEDDAAERLCALCLGDNIARGEPSEGKIELTALCDGVFCADVNLLNRINMVDSIAIASRHAFTAVKAGDKLAGMRVIPLAIPESALQEAERFAGGSKIFRVAPYVRKTACIVTTGSEIAEGRIQDTFTPVIVEKLARFEISVKKHIVTDDGRVTSAINKALEEKPDILLCAGGMSVDPDDNTPGAIRESGARIVTYGAPVLPGAMFMLGYYPDGTAVMGLPGCVMSAKATVFDIVLPRIAAGIAMTKQDFTVMGNGGLCLSCPECAYPVCPFGK